MSTRVVSLLIGSGFVICWTSGFVGGRLATEVSTAPLSLYAWRFALAALVAGVWWILRGARRPSRRALLAEATVGSLTIGVYLLAMLLAIEFGVSTAVAALIGALQPLVATVLAGQLLCERTSRRQWLGMGVASLGVTLCVADDLNGAGGAPVWLYALPLVSVAAVSLGSVLAARLPSADQVGVSLTVQFAAAGGVFMLAALVAGGGKMSAPSFDAETGLAMLWLIVLSSFGGYGFFVLSLRRLGVTLTSTLIYLTPPVTLIWALGMFGERPGPFGVAGMLVAGIGVVLAVSRRRSRSDLVACAEAR